MRKVSVIVPSFNGERKIPILLRALQNQTFQDFELVVMIDGSTDHTHQVVELTETIFPKTIFFQANQGRAIVKNNGVKHAKGDILIFYDDDMEPTSDSVERHVQFHNTYTGILSGNCLELESPQKTDIQNYKAALTKKWMRKYHENISELSRESLFFTAANCSMRKTLFNELNGFDERLTDAEDFDLAYRALDKRIPVFLDKRNIAIHHEQITCKSYILRSGQYRRAHVIINELHPERPVAQRSTQPIVRKLFYSFFSFRFWPSLIDNTLLLRVLPKILRYKIYDWVIYSRSEVYPD